MRIRGIDDRATDALVWVRLAATSALLAGLLFQPAPGPAAADHGCIRAPWPSFRGVAPTTRRVVVGTVAEDLWIGHVHWRTHLFRLDVEEVLRGSSSTQLEIRSLRSGLPRRIATDPRCDEYPSLRVGVGKRIAIAFEGRLPGIGKRIATVAFLEPSQERAGAERLTLRQVRRITGNAPDGSTSGAPREPRAPTPDVGDRHGLPLESPGAPALTGLDERSKPTAPSMPPYDSTFPWPTLTPPYDVPLPSALQPKGPPDASTTKHGIRVDLWLSSPLAAPGEWVQAVVKSTNLLGTPAWSMPTGCGRSSTVVAIDPRSGVPIGEDHEGNAAVLKQKAIRRGPYLWDGFDKRKDVVRWVTSSAVADPARAFVECTGPSEPRRLGPRATVTERFAWYPASSFDEDVWFQPLWPGTAAVTVSWPFLGRGERPSGDNQDLWRRIKHVEATTNTEIGGDGPGTPSIPELVDSALAHPRFRAWVDEDPTRESWNGVSWGSASGPTYPHIMYSMGLQNAPPNGLLWLELDRNHVQRGVVTLDPWTGEVLRVHCMGPSPSRPCEGPTVLDEVPS